MRLRWGLFIALLLPAASLAATIEVSGEILAVIHTGDTLVFHLSTSNYGVSAALYSQSLSPTGVDFALVSAEPGLAAKFAATLESADRAVSVSFGVLTFGPGYFAGSQYTGPVSTLEASLSLDELVSESIFADSSAVIALRNLGPDVILGLDPYVLRQDLYAGLSAGPLTVGAVTASVELESAVKRGRVTNFGGLGPLGLDAKVPEPASGGLLLGGGVLLVGFSALLARVSRRSPYPAPGCRR